MEVEFWASTDTGRQRDHNEDNFLVDKGLRLFVVCDGMGGHAAGDVASAIGVQTIRDHVETHRDRLEVSPPLDASAERDVLEVLASAVSEANARIYELSNRNEAEGGMGTTCSLLMVRDRLGFVAHVGDSRIYRCGRRDCHQITDDHSLRSRMIREGQLEPDEEFSQSNAITRAVGMNETLEVDTFTIDLHPGDRFLLCSDGLSEYVETSDIDDLTADVDLRTATEQCIDFANQSGGKDNVTVVMLELDEGEGVWETRETRDLARAIREIPHFEHLSTDDRLAIAEIVDLWELDEGVEVFGGDSEEALFVVVEGSVQLERNDRVLDILQVGEYVGEMALFGRSQPDLSARTREASTLLRISREAFHEYLRRDQRRALKVLWNTLDHFADKLSFLRYEEFQRPGSIPTAADDETTDVRGESSDAATPDDTGEMGSRERADSEPPPIPSGVGSESSPLVLEDETTEGKGGDEERSGLARRETPAVSRERDGSDGERSRRTGGDPFPDGERHSTEGRRGRSRRDADEADVRDATSTDASDDASQASDDASTDDVDATIERPVDAAASATTSTGETTTGDTSGEADEDDDSDDSDEDDASIRETVRLNIDDDDVL